MIALVAAAATVAISCLGSRQFEDRVIPVCSSRAHVCVAR